MRNYAFIVIPVEENQWWILLKTTKYDFDGKSKK